MMSLTRQLVETIVELGSGEDGACRCMSAICQGFSVGITANGRTEIIKPTPKTVDAAIARLEALK